MSAEHLDRPHLVVVGGGITGLAAAWEARDRARVTVLEASPLLGGRIRAGTVGDAVVEDGPDMFLARVPWATDLCREVGLGDDLVAPATSSAWVWSHGALRRLPERLALGVPTDLVALARSGILSPSGLARAAVDLVRPRTPPRGDESVAGVIGRRFGREVVDRLVAPLLGGINAGDVDHLSLEAAAPQLAEAARKHRSLFLGLRAGRRGGGEGAAGAGPVFHSVRGGLQRLVEGLERGLRDHGVNLRTATPVTKVTTSSPDGRPAAVTADGTVHQADAVVLASPAPPAATLLADVAPAAAAEIDQIRHASVAVVLLALARDHVAHPLDGSGLLVPQVEGRTVTACTFWSSKWPGTAPASQAILRVSVGRLGDDRAETLDDVDLTAAVVDDLADVLGVTGRPLDVRIVRWPRSFPQYEPGHLARVDRIDALLAAAAPGVAVAGAPYRGVGIPACVRQGRDAANRLLGER